MRVRTHPGEVLAEEFLKPLQLSANALGRELGVPANRISEIVNGSRALTADTALRLGRYFKTTPQFWMNLQVAHDLSLAEEAKGRQIKARIRPREMRRAS
jgi:addiction module HigA family antidote